MSVSQLRIPLGDGCLVCDGFRLLVAGRPSLDFDGDLLWAIEQRIWRPLAVALNARDDGLYVQPLPLAQQPAFAAQQVCSWRDDPVRLDVLADAREPEQVLAWCRARWPQAAIGASTLECSAFAWGRLLRLDARRAGLAADGGEHFLLPHDAPCVYLGYLQLDWPRLRFELNS